MPQPGLDIRKLLLIAVGVALASFAVYWPTLGYGLVNYDDISNIETNPYVNTGLSIDNIKWAFTSMGFANYYPMTWVSFQLDAAIWGKWYGGFHLTNVILHSVAASLLLWFLWAATGSVWRSAAVAALFAVHPAHVESVAWVTERKDVLSTAFGMAALVAYVYYSRKPSATRMVAVASLTLLGMLAKPMIVTWPALLLVLDYWPLRRFSNQYEAGAAPGLFAVSSPRRLVLEKIPIFVMTIGISIATYLAQQKGLAVRALDEHGIFERCANALVAYLKYVGLLFWPTNLAVLYPLHPIPEWQWCSAFFVLLLVFAALFQQRNRRPYLLSGWLWFVGTLVPVIGIIQVGGQSMADRYSYVPHMGLMIAVVWLAADAPQLRKSPRAVGAMVVTLAIVLCVMSWRQVQLWRDSFTLWTHTLSVTKDNIIAHSNLAADLTTRGKEADALPHLLEIARLAPNASDRQNAAGMMLMFLGRYAQAVPYLRAAAENPTNVRGTYVSRVNLIKALRASGQAAEAEFELRKLRSDPDVPQLLVEAELDLGGAIAQYRAQVAANPRNAVARNVLGVSLARSGDLTGAMEQFRKALEIDPTMTDARDNLEHARLLIERANATPGQAKP